MAHFEKASKAHIKLNTRKIYMADGYAVKELLKIANLLYQAATTSLGNENSAPMPSTIDLSSKLAQIKLCRTLASGLTEKGSALYDLLGNEVELRVCYRVLIPKNMRNTVISKPFELKSMETAVSESIQQLSSQMQGMRSTIENLSSDEMNLMAKIDKKRMELDRAEKRLKSLQGVR